MKQKTPSQKIETKHVSTRGASVLIALSVLFALSLLVLLYAENAIAERSRWTAFLMYLPQQPLLVPPLFLLLWNIALLHRQRRLSTQQDATRKKLRISMLTNMLSLLLVVFVFLGLNVPIFSREKALANAPKLRLMTLNMHMGVSGVEKIAREIKHQKPDVVCVQEARGMKNIPDPMPKMRAQFRGWHIAHHGEVATLSRFPILSTQVHKITNLRRVVLETKIAVRGKSVSVFNTHFITDRVRLKNDPNDPRMLGGSAKLRLHQMKELMRMVPRNAPRVFVAGDLNNPPRGIVYRRLTMNWRDSFAAAGWGFGFTYRADLPVMRIDYIFASRDVRVLSARTHNAKISDHRAVIADFGF